MRGELTTSMERKNITNTAKLVISVWNIGLFALVWIGFYNKFAFDRYRVLGAIMSILIYGFIYFMMCNVYKAFRIASTNIGEVVFAQIVAYGVADLILYVECCLINNNYRNVFPGLFVAILQGIGTSVIVTITKRAFCKYVEPKPTLLVFGKNVSDRQVQDFSEKLLEKYKHLFCIRKRLSEEEQEEYILEEIEQNHTIIAYEVSQENRGKLLKRCSELHKRIYFTPTIEDILCQGASYKQLLDTPLMKYDYRYEDKPEYVAKRVFDIVASVLLLIITSPLFAIIAIAIKAEDGGPVFFRQLRCTKNGVPFEIIKFRSMIVDAEKNGVQPCTGDDPRVTKVGKYIRKSRLDEIPQLINILKGEMSLVGPRPERIEHVEKYTKEMPEFAYRLRVKGGLTGYAQIYGKYNTSAYDKLRLDLMYIENQSLLVDLKIVMLTFRTMFQKERTEGFMLPSDSGRAEEE